ncbi:MAG: hypothetical protein L6R40_004150 [Gallowayella cf. fulva]|nr:MAG: hypothetical protein L6R40_004150 [Xanthomendoza cf. fulva]
MAGLSQKLVSSTELVKLLREFEATTPRPAASAPQSLARVLLNVGHIGLHVDPRLPHYLETLLDARELGVASLLKATFAVTRPINPAESVSASLDAEEPSKPSLGSIVLQLLTRKIANGIIEQDTGLLAFLVELLPWITQNPSFYHLGLYGSAGGLTKCKSEKFASLDPSSQQARIDVRSQS